MPWWAATREASEPILFVSGARPCSLLQRFCSDLGPQLHEREGPRQ